LHRSPFRCVDKYTGSVAVAPSGCAVD
jgi:hypothetical protein